MSKLGDGDRSTLLRAAREAIRAATQGRVATPPVERTAALSEPHACFVTLHLEGSLRGCIGSLEPHGSLLDAVMRNARAAAMEDPRFPPLNPEEEPRVRLEISILEPCEVLEHRSTEDVVKQLFPGRDGVILRGRGHLATFLPQVWTQLPDPVQFMEHLSCKAGDPGLWRRPEAEILRYQAETFEE